MSRQTRMSKLSGDLLVTNVRDLMQPPENGLDCIFSNCMMLSGRLLVSSLCILRLSLDERSEIWHSHRRETSGQY